MWDLLHIDREMSGISNICTLYVVIFSGSAVCCHSFSSEYSAFIGRNSSESFFNVT